MGTMHAQIIKKMLRQCAASCQFRQEASTKLLHSQYPHVALGPLAHEQRMPNSRTTGARADMTHECMSLLPCPRPIEKQVDGFQGVERVRTTS